MSKDWMTKKLPTEYDYVSPAGVSEIRLLPSFQEGEIVHATTPAEKPSIAATLTGVGEFFYILKGEGELWRATGRLEHVVSLHPGRCVSIPPGISYQYRAIGRPLEFLVTTVPRWQEENWTEAERRYWTDDGRVVGAASHAPGPWMTVDLPKEYHYLAPDGSEIRLLATVDAGGLAHSTLPAGTISGPVRHRTVKEIWYVVDGRGEFWRGTGLDEEVVELEPGTGLTIPSRVSFQFRAFQDGPLRVVIGTFPAWPGAAEAETVPGRWQVTR
jgi:mannose-6-phosphate isomerase-like protein (cupin superfamily)